MRRRLGTGPARNMGDALVPEGEMEQSAQAGTDATGYPVDPRPVTVESLSTKKRLVGELPWAPKGPSLTAQSVRRRRRIIASSTPALADVARDSATNTEHTEISNHMPPMTRVVDGWWPIQHHVVAAALPVAAVGVAVAVWLCDLHVTPPGSD